MEKRYREEIKSLWRIFQTISKSEKPERIATSISKEATRMLNGDFSSFLLLSENNSNLVKGYKLGKAFKSKIFLKAEEDFLKKTFKTNQVFSSSDIEKDARISFPEILKNERAASLICALVRAKDKLIGMLTVFSKEHRGCGDSCGSRAERGT